MRNNNPSLVRKHPIAWCPICNHTILYSDDPRQKKDIVVFPLYDGYHGKSYLCSKCKTMLAIIDKSLVPLDYTVLPIYSARCI